MNRHMITLAALGIAGMLAGTGALPAAQAQQPEAVYRAELTPINPTITGTDVYGDAEFTITGDDLTMRVTARGLPRHIEHWQHLHGFIEGDGESACPTVDADANGDMVIDLIETEPMAGTTMVPLNDDPVSMNIPTDTYPRAGEDGAFFYEEIASLQAMEEAFTEQFPGQELDLDRRVIFIHGVPESTILPETVASLGDIPAQVTLPIACGVIEQIEPGTPTAATPLATPDA